MSGTASILRRLWNTESLVATHARCDCEIPCPERGLDLERKRLTNFAELMWRSL
jgi:hypothetical protein